MEKETNKQTETENNSKSNKNSDLKKEADYKNETEEIDPFYFKRHTGSCRILQIILMTPIATIRFICVLFLLFVQWLIARIGLCCQSDNQIYNRPMRGFQKKCQNGCRRVIRAMYFCIGIHSVDVKGKLVRMETQPISRLAIVVFCPCLLKLCVCT